MSHKIVRAGWMRRRSRILKKWKKQWFSLNADGTLRYFNNQDDHRAVEAYDVHTDLFDLRTGREVEGVTPPEGCGMSCLMELDFTESRLLLCAESPDDLRAWELTINDMRSERPSTFRDCGLPPVAEEEYPGQQGQQAPQAYPGQMMYGTHPPPYVVGNGHPGQEMMVDDGFPYYERNRVDGTDLALGVVAGAAMGSLLWGPLLFF